MKGLLELGARFFIMVAGGNDTPDTKRAIRIYRITVAACLVAGFFFLLWYFWGE